MDQPSTALVRLNLETRPFHAAADEGWLDLLRNGVTRQDYIDRLITMYAFEAPLEAACAYTPHLRELLDLRERSRAGLIAQDLLALGVRAVDLTHVPQCAPIAPFSGPLEALGWMYVAERSTLLHEHVRRHVRVQVPEAATACAYLSAYDGVANARWNELGHVLDRVARTDALLHALVAAAHAGFRCFIEWSHPKESARRAR